MGAGGKGLMKVRGRATGRACMPYSTATCGEDSRDARCALRYEYFWPLALIQQAQAATNSGAIHPLLSPAAAPAAGA